MRRIWMLLLCIGIAWSQKGPPHREFGDINSGATLPHYAIGANIFSTEFQVFNLEETAVPFTLSFFDSSGNPQALGLFDEAGTSLGEMSVFSGVVNPGGLCILRTQATPELKQGYAEAESPGSSDVGLTAIIVSVENGQPQFRTFVPGLFDLQSPMRTPYTNTGGIFSGMAWMNQRSFAPVTVNLIGRDTNGTELCRQSVELGPRAHESFFLSDRLPCTANRNGTVDIVVTDGVGIAAILLSFDPDLRMWTQIPYEMCCFDIE